MVLVVVLGAALPELGLSCTDGSLVEQCKAFMAKERHYEAITIIITASSVSSLEMKWLYGLKKALVSGRNCWRFLIMSSSSIPVDVQILLNARLLERINEQVLLEDDYECELLKSRGTSTFWDLLCGICKETIGKATQGSLPDGIRDR